MNRMWQKAVGTAALGLMLAAPLTGCVARPAPRPEAVSPGAVDPALSAAVARTAAGVGGTGDVEAVVIGKTALVTIQLNAARPGGTNGGSLTGTTNDPDYSGTSPGGGPEYLQGPGGSVGASPAMPGGGISPGGSSPGGTPNTTQAVPNSGGGTATQTGVGETTAAPNPGSVGSSPFDVMTRVANRIRSEHKQIDEVRFAWTPEDARDLARIARAIQNGKAATGFTADLDRLRKAATPAGTTEYNPMHPPQGNYPSGPER